MQTTPKRPNLLFKRCAAFFYDCLLLIALYFIITAFAIYFNDGEAIQHFVYKGFLLIVAFLFFDGFWRHGGQTLGMRAWRIKVVANDQRPLTLKHSAFRFVSGSGLFVITLIFILISPDKRALHDIISDTDIVIDNN